MKYIFLIFILSSAALFAEKKDGSDYVDTGLILSHESFKSGNKFTAGIHLKMEKGWHTYWRNAGDAGLPTRVEWILPGGFEADSLQWPYPDKISFEGMANFGYENEVLLTAEISTPSITVVPEYEIIAIVTYLVCKDICLPGTDTVTAKIRTGVKSKPSLPAVMDIFNRFNDKYPQKEKLTGSGEIKEEIAELNLSLALEDPADVTFFPIDEGFFSNGNEQTINYHDGMMSLKIKLDNYRPEEPKRFYGLLVNKYGWKEFGGKKAIKINIPISQ